VADDCAACGDDCAGDHLAVHHAEVIAHRVDEALRLDRPRRRGDRDRGRPDLLPGRSTLQERGVHLIIFAAFVFLVFNP